MTWKKKSMNRNWNNVSSERKKMKKNVYIVSNYYIFVSWIL